LYGRLLLACRIWLGLVGLGLGLELGSPRVGLLLLLLLLRLLLVFPAMIGGGS